MNAIYESVNKNAFVEDEADEDEDLSFGGSVDPPGNLSFKNQSNIWIVCIITFNIVNTLHINDKHN